MSQRAIQKEVSAAEIALTGKKFCFKCNAYRLFIGGRVHVGSNGIKRWVCDKHPLRR